MSHDAMNADDGTPETSDSDVLILNIGGLRSVQTLRRTLTFVPGSFLASCFSGRWDKSIARDRDGNYFIDDDPAIFLLILDFLRDISRETTLSRRIEPPSFPNDPYLEQRLRLAVDHYGLEDAFYPFALHRVPPGVSGPAVFMCESILNHQLSSLEDSDGRYCVDLKRKDSRSPFQRQVNSFSLTLLDGEAGIVEVGWIARGTNFTGNNPTMICLVLNINDVSRRWSAGISHYNISARETVPIFDEMKIEDLQDISCKQFPDGQFEWLVRDNPVARTRTPTGSPQNERLLPRVVDWVNLLDNCSMIPFVCVKEKTCCRISALEFGYYDLPR